MDEQEAPGQSHAKKESLQRVKGRICSLGRIQVNYLSRQRSC